MMVAVCNVTPDVRPCSNGWDSPFRLVLPVLVTVSVLVVSLVIGPYW